MTTPPCAANPELWFSNDANDITEARIICHTCPFADPCARIALALRPSDGIWAGRTAGAWGKARQRHQRTAQIVDVAIRWEASGVSHATAARELGVSVGALQKALERRKRLRSVS